MKRTHLAIAIACATAGFAPLSQAESFLDEITWVPQVAVQMKNLEFDQKLTGNGGLLECDREPCQGDLDVDLPSLSLSLSAIYKKAYISLQYEESLGDTHTDSDVPFNGVTAVNDLDPDLQTFRGEASTEVTREDFRVTIGYNVWRGANVFVGYLEGETTFTPEPRGDIFFVDTIQDFAPVFNLAQQMHDEGLTDYEQTYEEDGWFVGGGYSWRVGDIGSIAISVAYADLDSTYEDNFQATDGNGNLIDQDFSFEGDATGLSYGIRWSQPLTERMGYFIDLRRQDYDIEADEQGQFQPAEADSEEIITSISGGIQWFL